MNNPTPLHILEVVSVKGTLRITNFPDIQLSQRQPLVQNEEGVIFPLDLDAELGHHRSGRITTLDIGVEDELIIADHDGRKRIFLRVG